VLAVLADRGLRLLRAKAFPWAETP